MPQLNTANILILICKHENGIRLLLKDKINFEILLWIFSHTGWSTFLMFECLLNPP
jgi:hypothetical protein